MEAGSRLGSGCRLLPARLGPRPSVVLKGPGLSDKLWAVLVLLYGEHSPKGVLPCKKPNMQNQGN